MNTNSQFEFITSSQKVNENKETFLEKETENPFDLYVSPNFRANREFKSSVFAFLFSRDKYNALSLYNAINGTHYTNVDDLEFHDLDDALFIGMRNDTSFIFDRSLNLYEHQSTYNPNMPLRGFFYIADLYKRIVDKRRLYHSSLIKLPYPQYIVFYNGTDKASAAPISTMRLSDAFDSNNIPEGFEFTAKIININEGYNDDIKAACKVLSDYCFFIEAIRRFRFDMPLKDAIIRAINLCVRKDILKEFLEEYRWEVAFMSWTEYNEDEMRQVYQEEIEELKKVYQDELNEVKQCYQNELDEVKQSYQVNLDEVKQGYEDKLEKTKQGYQVNLDEVKQGYEDKLEKTKQGYQEEINRLKTLLMHQQNNKSE